MQLFCMYRTWGHLLYVKKDVYIHFQELMKRYHSVSHAGGKMYVKSSSSLRNMSNVILLSVSLKKQFKQFTNLGNDYVDKVYQRYVLRVERMHAGELERKSVENLKRSGGSLEQLRQVKGNVNSNKKIKLM